jgi:hypothetical protein
MTANYISVRLASLICTLHRQRDATRVDFGWVWCAVSSRTWLAGMRVLLRKAKFIVYSRVLRVVWVSSRCWLSGAASLGAWRGEICAISGVVWDPGFLRVRNIEYCCQLVTLYMFLGPRVVFKLIARRPHLVDTIISKALSLRLQRWSFRCWWQILKKYLTLQIQKQELIFCMVSFRVLNSL